MPYSCLELGKMSQILSSAAVVIGALWVKFCNHSVEEEVDDLW